MRKCGTSMENENQIKLDRAAYDIKSSFCHRSERENFLENKKCFFFPLNLLQKLRAKALSGC